MKKTPLYYKNQVVGYVDDIVYNNDIIEIIKIYLFYCEYYNDIVENIKKSSYSTLSLFGNENNKYIFDFDDEMIICKIKK